MVEVINDDGTILLVVSYFEKLEENVTSSLVSVIIDILEELKSAVISGKLSGGVLNVKSGKLASSIETDIFQNPNAITGVVMQNIGIAPYGPIHEHGGVFEIPQHPRVTASGKISIVRAHERTVPQRSFMESTMDQFRNTIHNRLVAALGEGLRK